MFKRLLILFIMVCGFVYCGMYLMQWGTQDNSKNIEFIQSHCYNDHVVDMQNELSVGENGKNIIWYYDKHKLIVIEYGKVVLKYKTKDFITKGVQDELQSIFITTKQNKNTLEFKLYFCGEEIPQYVKV